MKKLEIGDYCIKFFNNSPIALSGPGSISYKAHTVYENGYYYFFRTDELYNNCDYLLYALGYGDMMANVVVDEYTVNNAKEASPDHFCVNKINIGEIYCLDDKEVLDLIYKTFNTTNVSKIQFKDIVSFLFKSQAITNGYKIYSAFKAKYTLTEMDEKNIVDGAYNVPKGITFHIIRDIKTVDDLYHYLQNRLNMKN